MSDIQLLIQIKSWISLILLPIQINFYSNNLTLCLYQAFIGYGFSWVTLYTYTYYCTKGTSGQHDWANFTLVITTTFPALVIYTEDNFSIKQRFLNTWDNSCNLIGSCPFLYHTIIKDTASGLRIDPFSFQSFYLFFKVCKNDNKCIFLKRDGLYGPI